MPGLNDNEDLEVMDRGDTIPGPDDTRGEKDPVEKEVDEKLDLDKEDEPEEKGEEQPRTPDGKFAKKEDDGPRIPKSRFDEAVAKERERADAMERELAEIKARLDAQEKAKEESQKVDERQVEIDTLDAKINELHAKRDEMLADGNAKEASELLREIRAEERRLSRLEAEIVAEKSAAKATGKLSEEQLLQQESARLDSVVTKLEETYDVLNKDSENFKPRMIDLVVAEQQRLMATQKLSPSQALEKAANDIMEEFGFAKKAAEKEEKPEDKAEQRRVEARTKAADAAKKQPGSMKDVGLNSNAAGAKSSELEVDKLSDKEFGALSEEQLAKLRGDFV